MKFKAFHCCFDSCYFRVVDADNAPIYALSTMTMQWSKPQPVTSADYLDEALKIADTDIIRAKRRCEAAKFRALSQSNLLTYVSTLDGFCIRRSWRRNSWVRWSECHSRSLFLEEEDACKWTQQHDDSTLPGISHIVLVISITSIFMCSVGVLH